MQTPSRNIYQIARSAKGLTQERAAELIDISVESVRAYESGRVIPPTSVVLHMIDVYEYPVLALQHLRNSSDLANCLLPDLQDGTTLSEAVLGLLSSMDEFDAIAKDLRSIAKDNVIDESERPRFNRALVTLQSAADAIMAVRFAKSNEGRN